MIARELHDLLRTPGTTWFSPHLHMETMRKQMKFPDTPGGCHNWDPVYAGNRITTRFSGTRSIPSDVTRHGKAEWK